MGVGNFMLVQWFETNLEPSGDITKIEMVYLIRIELVLI